MADPFYLQQYKFETPPRFWSTESFSTNPIEPQLLIDEVAKRLQFYGNVIPLKNPQMVSELCKGFNECIRLNQTGDIPQTIIFSPKTGSAKSTSAKTYISLLKEVSSLVVVPRVDDAISYCCEINELSNDSDYARCYFRISDKHPDCDVRVDRQHINDFRYIVITHSMLRTISQYGETSVANALKEKQRDLVIVDERLNDRLPCQAPFLLPMTSTTMPPRSAIAPTIGGSGIVFVFSAVTWRGPRSTTLRFATPSCQTGPRKKRPS